MHSQNICCVRIKMKMIFVFILTQFFYVLIIENGFQIREGKPEDH